MKQELRKQLSLTLKQLYALKISPQDIHLEHPQEYAHGDWATNIALVLAKDLDKNSYNIAEEVADKLALQQLEQIAQISVAQPGFINFKLKDSYYKQSLLALLATPGGYGENGRLKGKQIMVEFAHPNPFKSFHIGHLRNIILGESIVRLLESQGAEVIRTNYQGDVGMHIAKCLWAFQKVDPSIYPETTDEKVALLGKCYAQGAQIFEQDDNVKKEIQTINEEIYSKENPEINKLWELGKAWSLEKFHEIYERLYTYFHREYMESETLEYIDNAVTLAIDKGILKYSEGALIFDGGPYGLDTRVFLNSKGLPTYEGKELGLAQLKTEEYGIVDLHIHNVAVEQKSFFAVTFKVKELLWPKAFKNRQYHNAYEFVGLKRGKMSSRKGNVVLGNDILNEAHKRIYQIVKSRENIENPEDISEIVGTGAIKWSFLKISPFKYLAFDLDESVSFEGDSGPYVQYTYARAKAILRSTVPFDSSESLESTLNTQEELDILRWLERFPEIVENASIEYAPNYLTNYLFELSQKFNTFYKSHSVLNTEREEDRISRLMLTQAVSEVIKQGLNFLGIKTAEKM